MLKDWIPQALKDLFKDLPGAARPVAILAVISVAIALMWWWVTGGIKSGPAGWLVPVIFGFLAVVSLLAAFYFVVRDNIRRKRTRRLQRFYASMPPGLHVGCRIGRRRLECGVLDVKIAGFPTWESDVRYWRDKQLFQGALLRKAEQGLFEHKELYREIGTSIAELFRIAGLKGVGIASIGIAIPGGVYPDRGTFDDVVAGVSIGKDEDVTQRVADSLLEHVGEVGLRKVFGTSDADEMREKIHLDNDARCAARWLLVDDRAKEPQGERWNDFVCVFAGSGLGSGLVIERKVFYGNHFRAGEVGHLNLNLGSRLFLRQDGDQWALKERSCSCGKYGYHFESLVGIGGLGHLADVIDGAKLTQIRDVYMADSDRKESSEASKIDDADRDGMIVLRTLAVIGQQALISIEQMQDSVLRGLAKDKAFRSLIDNGPIRDYLGLVVKEYAYLFGTGIAAVLDALDVEHIALCGTIPEYLQHNRTFKQELPKALVGQGPGIQQIDLETGSMLRWGWRGAALLPRDREYMSRRLTP